MEWAVCQGQGLAASAGPDTDQQMPVSPPHRTSPCCVDVDLVPEALPALSDCANISRSPCLARLSPGPPGQHVNLLGRACLPASVHTAVVACSLCLIFLLFLFSFSLSCGPGHPVCPAPSSPALSAVLIAVPRSDSQAPGAGDGGRSSFVHSSLRAF